METNLITCPKCGQLLGHILGEIGERRRIKPLDRVRTRTDKNALGEELGWIKCPKCRKEARVDASYLIDDR